MGRRLAAMAAGAVLWSLLHAPAPVSGQDGFSGVIKDRQERFQGRSGGPTRVPGSSARKSADIDPQVVAYGLGGIGLLIVLAYLVNRRSASRRPMLEAVPGVQASQQGFRQQAVALGFRPRETRVLRKLAMRVSPQLPTNVLTTPSGREYLIGDVQQRIRQREREITLLQTLYDKLGRISAQKIHERDSVRVEADLPVWVVQRGQEQRSGSEADDAALEVDPTAGQMLDISEGGAAIAVDLVAKRGDTIEFWSADSEVWIPPVMAGVVHVRPPQADAPSVLHLHFLDPPEEELRTAIQDLQARSERGDAAE